MKKLLLICVIAFAACSHKPEKKWFYVVMYSGPKGIPVNQHFNWQDLEDEIANMGYQSRDEAFEKYNALQRFELQYIKKYWFNRIDSFEIK